MSSSPTIIETRDVSKRVDAPEGVLTILSDINLTIHRSEAVAVVGPSGSGKSTLLGLMAGLDLPSEGEVILDQTPLNGLSEDGRARLRAGRVGFVFQSFQLLPHLTALENVMLPLELSGQKEARDAAEALIERVGLTGRRHHYPHQLSGGEQQRVAIARAFSARPQILFADEPTGNLDGRTGQRVSDLLFELNSERGTTLVLVTHDTHLAERCHRQFSLDEGRLQVES